MGYVDLSSNNAHPIPWQALKDAGCTGARIKATQGDYYTNPDFGSDAATAAASGMEWGPYWMLDYTQPVDPQLNYFHAHYGGNGQIRPAVDCEPLQNKPVPAWSSLHSMMSRVAWFMTAWYGDMDFYVDQNWAENLEPFGFPYNRGIWLATGARGITAVRSAQLLPVTINGQQFDWSVGL